MACNTGSWSLRVPLLMGLMATVSTHSEYTHNLTACGSVVGAVRARTSPLLQNSAATGGWLGFCLRGLIASQDIFSHQIITRVISLCPKGCLLSYRQKEQCIRRMAIRFGFTFFQCHSKIYIFSKVDFFLIILNMNLHFKAA